MVCCPYRRNQCREYLSRARELSASLADRIEDNYCESDFFARSRYQAVTVGMLDAGSDLAPWSESPIGHLPGRYATDRSNRRSATN